MIQFRSNFSFRRQFLVPDTNPFCFDSPTAACKHNVVTKGMATVGACTYGGA